MPTGERLPTSRNSMKLELADISAHHNLRSSINRTRSDLTVLAHPDSLYLKLRSLSNAKRGPRMQDWHPGIYDVDSWTPPWEM